jgi:hypothetical protein
MARTITIDRARAAKAKVAKLIGKHPDVTGIGIARVGTGYGVKLNLVEGTLDATVPRKIDGVPVKVETVGRISKRPSKAGTVGRVAKRPAKAASHRAR